MKLKKLVWWLPLVALLIGCGGKPTAKTLVEIDSLLAAEKNDSAYQIISSYDAASFKKEADRAYYNLLMTHAARQFFTLTEPQPNRVHDGVQLMFTVLSRRIVGSGCLSIMLIPFLRQ